MGTVPESTFAYIRGTLYSTYTDSFGKFFLGSLPAGSFEIDIDYPPAETEDAVAGSAPASDANMQGSEETIEFSYSAISEPAYLNFRNTADTLDAAGEAESDSTADNFTVTSNDTMHVQITIK